VRNGGALLQQSAPRAVFHAPDDGPVSDGTDIKMMSF
jgi:hypothetical protein